MEQEHLAHGLRAWVEQVTDSPISRATRLTGGNRREGWLVDLQRGNTSPERVYLRVDVSPPGDAADPFTLAREGVVYRALREAYGRIPALLAEHPTGKALLIEAVPGESDYGAVTDVDTRTKISEDLVEALVELHSIDPLDLADLSPSLRPLPSISANTMHQLEQWSDAYQRSGRPDTLIELGRHWLVEHLPAPSDAPRIVHGDFGPGNFIFTGGSVTALIDWELAHIGDPVEDLAWLSMRSVFAPVPDLAALVKRYETSSGLVVDRDRLLYHRVFVQWRVAVIRHLAIGDPDPGGDVGTGLISQAVNRRLLVEAMAQASGVPLSAPPPLDAGHDGPRDWLYEAVLALVRNDIAPHLLDPVGAARSRSVSRIVKYLRDQERLAPAAQARELASLRNLLGNVEDLESARHELVRRVVEKRVPLSTTIPHLWLVVSDETDMQRSGLGALADAHLPVF